MQVDDLIAEARAKDPRDVQAWGTLLDRLADALEAVSARPLVADREAVIERTEGSALDYFLRSLNGDEAGHVDYVSAMDGATGWVMRGGNDVGAVLLVALDALFASGVIREAEPLVADREAVARVLDPWPWESGDPRHATVHIAREEARKKADALFASGVIRQAGPLVADEDAVRERIAYSLAMEHGHVDYPEGGQVDRASQSAARALFASGVIQPKAEAQAEALEEAAEAIEAAPGPIRPDLVLDEVAYLRARAAAYRTPASPNPEEADRA